MVKTLQLSDEAYRSLAASRLPGESFSDAVLRILQGDKDPRNLLRLGPRLPGWDLDAVRQEDRRFL